MTVVFNHIPKTAGASFRSLLKKQYGNSIYEIADDNLSADVNQFLSFSLEKQNSFALISGHCSEYCNRNLLNEKNVVFLRDPFNQLMSTYYQIRKNPSNMWHQVSKKCESVIEVAKFVEDYGLNNLQTRFLASDAGLLNLLETKGAVMNQLNEFDFELALKNLKETKLIGLTEQFDKSVLHFKRILGWNTPFYTRSNNTSSNNKLMFSEEEEDKVRSVQFFDEKIYSEAHRLFNKSLEQSNISNLELIYFRVKNNTYNSIKRVRNKLQKIN